MCEQLGEEPDPKKLPVERGQFPIEVQEAFLLHDILSDKWEGMSGHYLGKDFSALDTYIKVFKIQDPQTSVWFLKHIEYYNTKVVNETQDRKRKAEERKLKSRRK